MTPTSPTCVVEVSNVDKHFTTGNHSLHVLKKVCLNAYSGELLMLVGPSGCGKTTLISAIAGTLAVEQGAINVFNHPLHQLSNSALTRFRAKHIGFVFQQFNLIPTINIAENVAVPLLIQGKSMRTAIDRARDTLNHVGLGDRWREAPNKLSGGQQQRVAIARALVHQPPLVICDEPTASLDAQNGEIVLDLFRNVACSPNRAVIIVTHDNRIFSYADRIAHMDDGQIISEKHHTHTTPPHLIHHSITEP